MNSNSDIMQLSNFNYLGRKCHTEPLADRKKGLKITEDLDEMAKPLEGYFRIMSNKNCNFKLKRNKIRKVKNRCPAIEKNNLNKDTPITHIPRAPHNTSQYLIENYKENNIENLKNHLLTICPNERKSQFSAFEEDSDGLCITGGTMKGIINSKNFLGLLLQSNWNEILDDNEDEKDGVSVLSTEFSIQETDNAIYDYITTEYLPYEYS
jgi:hypothetical protein